MKIYFVDSKNKTKLFIDIDILKHEFLSALMKVCEVFKFMKTRTHSFI